MFISTIIYHSPCSIGIIELIKMSSNYSIMTCQIGIKRYVYSHMKRQFKKKGKKNSHKYLNVS